MNSDEVIAHTYLVRRFSAHRVEFEPDGNVPPDFYVKDGPAVEVRRLNLHDFSVSPPRPTEDSIRLLSSAENFLARFGPPQNKASWFVCFRFRKLPENWRDVRKRIEIRLSAFLEAPIYETVDLEVDDNLKITILPSTEILESVFVLGSLYSLDSGYRVGAALVKNIEYCAAEKARKIRSYKNRYQTWWLILIDRIAFDSSPDDLEQLRRHLLASSIWDAVILIGDPEAKRVVEI
jgi:hypothetical protein